MAAGFNNFGILLAVVSLLGTFFLNNSPYKMTSTAPTKVWADQPMRLITTPQFETKKVNAQTHILHVVIHSSHEPRRRKSRRGSPEE